MYEGRLFVAGRVADLGNDAVEKDLTDEDRSFLVGLRSRFGLETDPTAFRKFESGRRLWNFSTKEIGIWKEAL